MPSSEKEQSLHLLQGHKRFTSVSSYASSTSSSSTISSNAVPASPSRVLFGEKDYSYSQHEEFDELDGVSLTGRFAWLRCYSWAEAFRLSRVGIGIFIAAILPSFFFKNRAPKAKLHPTAYLDGLRGVAAFFVFIHHFILDWFPALSSGYSSSPADVWFLQWPFVRIVYSGRGMVALFFVISGYVLSYKCLRQVRRHELSGTLETLTSSVFRRGIRLFLPITISTFISLLIIRKNWYIHDPQYANLLPERKETLREQFWDWNHHLYLTTNPFQLIDGKNLYGNPYDGHLWTIPIEFRGSIVVFLTLLGLAKTKQVVRLSLMIVLTLYTLYITHWDLFLFLSGMLLCEVDFLRSSSTVEGHILPQTRLPPTVNRFYDLTARFKTPLTHLWTLPTFALGVHLLAYPDRQAALTPGYISMTVYLTPSQYEPFTNPAMTQRFWLSIGAVLTCLALSFSAPLSLPSISCFRRSPSALTATSSTVPSLQRPFTSPFAQYLGKISFALYLVHGPVLYTLGMQILYKARQPGQEDRYTYWFLWAVLVNASICLWAADVFWRLVDARSVWFAGWVKRKCWVGEK
ncbi:hypothetical protein BP6252_13562 [Coleophoma cylindrospora]|uniref:Acyltransferase 3 domain-containing protein n=1 Tax=Coleophoma cylindrospora TaxID=1849047 RepID=A0A3D8Q8M9_9HELO|nr:hypothetical protein BP6252_13562 [Coleophoma cylindrospora]